VAYRFVPFPVTLDYLEGQSPVTGLIKCNSTNIYATFRTVSTDTVPSVVPQYDTIRDAILTCARKPT